MICFYESCDTKGQERGQEVVGRGRNNVGRGRKGQVEVENDQVGPGRGRKYLSVPTPVMETRLKEQQTRDNLIVKDYCFIIEIFDKFTFSGIRKLKSFK